MSSVRKRKFMLRKLNTYFVRLGYIPSEQEYNASSNVPYRREIIKKYLGGWARMVNYLQFYYPEWKETVEPEQEPQETPKINLEALEQTNDE